MKKDILLDFLSLFFPSYCYGCSEGLVKGEDTLCTKCLSELPRTNYHRQADNPVVKRFAGRIPVVHGLAFLHFHKNGIAQHLIHQMKYNHHPEIGIRLGKVFAHELADEGFFDKFDLIVPVPLHHSRKRKRGYNQASMIAQGMSAGLAIPWDESISVRLKSTATQTKKSKIERWENVKDVFWIQNSEKISEKRILLVDDIITTGSTLEACGRHLLDIGCSSLSVGCLAEVQ